MKKPIKQQKGDHSKNVLIFIKEIAKYFMDFLETDFHRRRISKRNVKTRNKDNLVIGLNLNKYPTFNNLIWKFINHAFNKNIQIKKGVYKTNIPENLLGLIKVQIKKLSSKQITHVIKSVSKEIKKAITLYKKEYNKALMHSLENASGIVKKELVLPFISSLEKPLEDLNLGDENAIYLMEEELTAVLIGLLENKISEILKLLLAKEKVDILKQLGLVFNIDDVKNNIINFFEDFKVTDLFTEVFEMDRNRNILDKQEFYLYFCDIAFNKVRYPIFYIPLTISKQNDIFIIDFDSQVYINKKALKYIAQEYNREKGKRGSLKAISERIIYLAKYQNDFREIINNVIKEIINFFELDSDINISNPSRQFSKSLLVKISNSCYMNLSDKSDEALINDYEEILQLLESKDSVLAKAFDNLIGNFIHIHKEPKSFDQKVEDEWDDLGTSDKLVFKSPIPLNSEQRKILSAIKKNKCKYITVEGPPGTGKSHTITGIVFEAILKNQSVLVLSDKKEALDVVEDKITETMNSVRHDKNFQNPILRLGKTGSTYSQILSTASMQNIKNNYKAVKKNYEALEENIEKSVNSLKEDLEAELLAYSEIDIKEIYEFFKLLFYFERKGYVIDIKETFNNIDSAVELEEIRRIFLNFGNKLHRHGFDFNIGSKITNENLNNIDKIIEILSRINSIKKEITNIQKLEFVKKHQDKINFQNIKKLLQFYKDLRQGLDTKPKLLKLFNVQQKDLKNVLSFEILLNNFIWIDGALKKIKDVCGEGINKLNSFKVFYDKDIGKLKRFVHKYSNLKNLVFGYMGKKREIERLNREFKKGFPFSKFDKPHKNLNDLKEILELYNYAIELKKEFPADLKSKIDYLNLITELFKNPNIFQEGLMELLFQDFFNRAQEYIEEIGSLYKKSWFNGLKIKTISDLNSIISMEEFLDLCDKFEDLYEEEKRLLSDKFKTDIDSAYRYLYLKDIINIISFLNKYKNFLKEMIGFRDDLAYLGEHLIKYPNTMKKIGADIKVFKSLYNNKFTNISDLEFNKLIRYLSLAQKIKTDFGNISSSNYSAQKKNIENLATTQMTHLMNERVIDFHQENIRTARVLREIIKSKQKFPRDKFSKLKEAFPCILAGIRDYAEYIPLDPEIFDMVIIDEASQVSIAQAFPAILRAKKIIIFGDKKQFSNVKAAHAHSETNDEYLSNLNDIFLRHVSKDPGSLPLLQKFNIKTSILEFFEFIRNYNAQLLKFFRGYKELISYSNRYFYNNLQVMKIRGKPIDEVLKFTIIDHDGKIELVLNTNIPEIKFIISELKKLKNEDSNLSVGIITPHTNQQKLIMEMINKSPERDYFFDKLKLKIMTFDTCQGEERDIIFYSMVATKELDRLWGVFIKDRSKVNLEEEGKIKVQRLNVGFSRAKECIHFVLSRPIDEYDGSIGEAIRHYYQTLEDAKKEKSVSEVDQKSKMEPKVMNWFYQTEFWKKNKENIEFIPQFKIGKYLKQLDGTYNYPDYVVDFLLVYKDELHKEHKIIIEYDGFREHFKNIDETNEFNYQYYYSDEDVYREKILESYGYKFLRINKFNIGENPIAILDERIKSLLEKKINSNKILDNIHQTIDMLDSGEMKECPKCKKIRTIEDFRDTSLITGYGRFCKICKPDKAGSVEVYEYESKKRTIEREKTCPRCRSNMILRNGRYGAFYGCSKFPYCKGTRPYN